MAVKSQAGSSLLALLRFFVRFLGLNGLVAIAVGLVLWHALDLEEAGMIVVISGGAAVALALLAEVRGLSGAVASHRGAAGLNVFIQVACAAALVIGANYYSFEHYKRFDLTHKQTFTLNDALREKLANLRGDTDIIVYLQHVSFGQRVDLRQDDADQAAEKIIARKIEDLVEQFSEIGPRFRVTIVDTQKKNIKERRAQIKGISEDLLRTMEKAPENSIFFYSRDTKQVQRLSFNDIYHLDKKASAEANGERGNLVLIDQGLQSFSDKVFNLEEKKPRVGIAVVHGWLGQEGADVFGMPGLKATLEARGFEGRDIVLWKRLQVEPAALEHAENRYEVLAAKKTRLERSLEEDAEELKDIKTAQEFWEKKKAEEINKDFALVMTFRGLQPVPRKQLEQIRKVQGKIPPTSPVTEEFRAEALKEYGEAVDFMEKELAGTRKKLDKTIEEQSKLPVENLKEQRRITDVRAKFNRLLANIDLLVVPRFTIMNLIERQAIRPDIHALHDAHIEAIKDFMKAGKPVLFCLGPRNTRLDDDENDTSKDSLEKLLAAFDLQLPNQTILFNTEGDALEERDERSQMGGASVNIPSAVFDWKPLASTRGLGSSGMPPIRSSMNLTTRGFGQKNTSALPIRYPRPVYLGRTTWTPETAASAIAGLSLSWPVSTSQSLATLFHKATTKYDEGAVFLMTPAECWNDDRPFPTEKRTPHFERPKSDDPAKGTLQEKTRGPFPIGVALEAPVPLEWYESDGMQQPKKVRLAVIGDGAVFVGEKLSPVREKMFVDVANWLLGRENLLAREGTTWQYPRVSLDPEIKRLWEWGARLGLPLLFVCLGMNVWLVRRMR